MMGNVRRPLVHFDPVASQDHPSVRSNPISSDEFEREIESPEGESPELESGEERPAARVREGLPKAFRMRHGRHYVDQLMGDAPIRTVREIAVADIEAPPDDSIDLQELERSIREMGVLEPLLVSQKGRRYRVIAGMNRLRAARTAGLPSVPCLVHEVDDEMLKNMREAAARRHVPPPPIEELPAEPQLSTDAQRDASLPPAFSEVTAGLNFISALMPAIDAAGENRFRWSVLMDLAGVELLRARMVAASAEVLAGQPALDRCDIRSGLLLESVVSVVAPEARLRGVALRTSAAEADYRATLDIRLTTTAITGLLQSLLAMSAPGSAVTIAMKGTSIRPALIIEMTVPDAELSAQTVQRFFDGEWREHPAGPSGSLLLAGAARVARLHGGRADIRASDPKGCVVTFVIPRPLGA
jgi:ParB-like nuclease family protein